MAKSKKEKDSLCGMEELLLRALLPGSHLYAYVEEELLSGDGKPDPKPLRELLSVLQQIRELRREDGPTELTVRFEDETARAWSE